MLNQNVLTQNREFKILFQPILVTDSNLSYSSIIRNVIPSVCKKFGTDINTLQCYFSDNISCWYDGINPIYSGGSTLCLIVQTNYCNIEKILDYIIVLIGMTENNAIEFRSTISIQPNIESVITPLCNSGISNGDNFLKNKDYDNAIVQYKDTINLYSMLSEFSQNRINGIKNCEQKIKTCEWKKFQSTWKFFKT